MVKTRSQCWFWRMILKTWVCFQLKGPSKHHKFSYSTWPFLGGLQQSLVWRWHTHVSKQKTSVLIPRAPKSLLCKHQSAGDGCQFQGNQLVSLSILLGCYLFPGVAYQLNCSIISNPWIDKEFAGFAGGLNQQKFLAILATQDDITNIQCDPMYLMTHMV